MLHDLLWLASSSIHKSPRASAQGSGVVFVLREVLLEALEGVAHPALAGVLGHAGDRGDVLEGEVADLPQEKDLPLLVGQRLDAARDALAELGPSRGRQVHRSWWVAEGAIASAERNAGRPVLVLRNGLRVPVSKTFRDQVKQAGWLD